MRALEAKKSRLNRRKLRIRGKISGTQQRPRLSVYKSNKHLYVQAIDDEKGFTLASGSTLKENTNPNREIAKKLGIDFSQKLKEAKIESVVFDRNGNAFHGVIKSFADSLRENGIKL